MHDVRSHNHRWCAEELGLCIETIDSTGFAMLGFEYFISIRATRSGHCVIRVDGFRIQVSDVGLASYPAQCPGGLCINRQGGCQ
jgi:hypothetical protein